jgi:hypothetical protein
MKNSLSQLDRPQSPKAPNVRMFWTMLELIRPKFGSFNASDACWSLSNAAPIAQPQHPWQAPPASVEPTRVRHPRNRRRPCHLQLHPFFNTTNHYLVQNFTTTHLKLHWTHLSTFAFDRRSSKTRTKRYLQGTICDADTSGALAWTLITAHRE